MSEPTREDFLAAMIAAGRSGLRSGIPREQLLHYLRATYRDHVSEIDVQQAVKLVLEESR